jgi:hypothetical protein
MSGPITESLDNDEKVNNFSIHLDSSGWLRAPIFA